jgi:thiosulfate reductase cytochrome b subunit
MLERERRRPRSWKLLALRAAVFALFALFTSPALSSPTADERPDNSVCFECHGLEGLDIRQQVTGRPRRISILKEDYEKSSHGKTDCAACHFPGYDTAVTHQRVVAYARWLCVDCHENLGDVEHLQLRQRQEDLIASAHGKKTNRRMDCHQCHDPHLFSLVRERGPAETRIDASNEICFYCHGKAEERLFGYEDLPDSNTTHDLFPNPERHLKKVKCVSCHTPPDSRTRHDVLMAEDSVRKCESCHRRDNPRFASSYQDLGASGGTPGEEKKGGDDAEQAALRDKLYVIGSTRSPLLDVLSQVGFALVFLATTVHAALRFATRKRRKPPTKKAPRPKPTFLMRVWHSLQVFLFFGLLVSGLSLHYNDSGFAPLGFQETILTHNALGVANAALFVAFFAFSIIRNGKRRYVGTTGSLFPNVKSQARHYIFGMFRGEAPPEPKGKLRFNPMQGLTYFVTMYLISPLVVISGCLLLFPFLAPERAMGFPGLWPMAFAHLAGGYLLTLFVVVHIYLSTTEGRKGAEQDGSSSGAEDGGDEDDNEDES